MPETTVRRSARAKKLDTSPVVEDSNLVSPASFGLATSFSQSFSDLVRIITQAQSDFEKLQKQIYETKESWLKEQQEHDRVITERNQQEELSRKREQETYLYNLQRDRQKAEDEFGDKKTAWEKQLRDQKDNLEKEQEELNNLRKVVATFEEEKSKAITKALETLQKELTSKFETDEKLREQEYKAERDILNLKISTLSAENSRQISEIEALKKALDDATKQVKEVAVKVIEAGSNHLKTQLNPQELTR